MVQPRKAAIIGRKRGRGYVPFASHLATVLRSTPSASAIACWVAPSASRLAWIDFITFTPFWCFAFPCDKMAGKGSGLVKLDMDCVRDVLLALENLTDIDEDHLHARITTSDVAKAVTNFKEKEVYNAIYTLYQADYIEADKIDFCGGSDFCIEAITWSGYELLNNLRSEQVWSAVKEKIKPLGSVSISVVSALATQVAKNLLGL